jgi:hypothetical protein
MRGWLQTPGESQLLLEQYLPKCDAALAIVAVLNSTYTGYPLPLAFRSMVTCRNSLHIALDGGMTDR